MWVTYILTLEADRGVVLKSRGLGFNSSRRSRKQKKTRDLFWRIREVAAKVLRLVLLRVCTWVDV